MFRYIVHKARHKSNVIERVWIRALNEVSSLPLWGMVQQIKTHLNRPPAGKYPPELCVSQCKVGECPVHVCICILYCSCSNRQTGRLPATATPSTLTHLGGCWQNVTMACCCITVPGITCYFLYSFLLPSSILLCCLLGMPAQ
jgi:hypothetical protein